MPGASYIGLDTETVDGKAVVICTPTRTGYPITSWGDVWRFLEQDCDPDGRVDYVCWNVTYDAQAILKHLPKRALRDLRTSGAATYRRWKVTFWPGKLLSIRTGKGRHEKLVRFFDAFPYYGMSLDKAGETYLGMRKMGIPASWLPDLAPVLANPRKRERVLRYCRRDADLTQRLWKLIRGQYEELGVDPCHAVSPGSIARRAFPDVYSVALDIPSWVDATFARAYYGGRSEILRRGRVGRVYCYDIHSAYPAALQRLKRPGPGMTIRTPGPTAPARDVAEYGYGVYYVRFTLNPDLWPVSPAPFRTRDGLLIFPCGDFTTWITLPELVACRRWSVPVRVIDGLELLPGRDAPPLFPDLTKWYNMKQSRPSARLAIKLTLNSLYGKFAERREIDVPVSLGERIPSNADYRQGRFTLRKGIPTKHTSYVIASAITGACRATVWNALMSLGPRHVVASHTDSIIATIPAGNRLDIGPGLGQWGYEGMLRDAVFIGCGVYCGSKSGKPYQRTRGFSSRLRLHELARCTTPVAEIDTLHALSLAQAARQGWDRLNVMDTIPKHLNVNMDRKRCWPADWRSFLDAFTLQQRSRPLLVVTRDVLREHGHRLPYRGRNNRKPRKK